MLPNPNPNPNISGPYMNTLIPPLGIRIGYHYSVFHWCFSGLGPPGLVRGLGPPPFILVPPGAYSPFSWLLRSTTPLSTPLLLEVVLVVVVGVVVVVVVVVFPRSLKEGRASGLSPRSPSEAS